MHNPGRAELPAIQPEIVGTNTARERCLVEKWHIKTGYFDEQPAVFIVPVQSHETRHGLVVGRCCIAVVGSALTTRQERGEHEYPTAT